MNSLGSQVAAVSINHISLVPSVCREMPKRTSHVGEFLAATFEVIAVLGLDGILDSTGGGVVNTQDGTLDQLDLSGRITSQTAAAAGASGGLSLAPCLSGGSLAASVRGSHTTGHAKSSGGIVRGLARIDGASTVGIVVGGLGGVGFGQTVT